MDITYLQYVVFLPSDLLSNGIKWIDNASYVQGPACCRFEGIGIAVGSFRRHIAKLKIKVLSPGMCLEPGLFHISHSSIINRFVL
jgi:hypothetical protein